MDWFINLFYSGSIAQATMLLMLSIATGIWLGRLTIHGVGLGIGGILITSLFFSCLGMSPDTTILRFIGEFGLILFVYSIGLEVGPGFIARFKSQGLLFNILTITTVLLGMAVTVVLWKIFDLPAPLAVGLFAGAVTNTPGLSAGTQILVESGIHDAAVMTGVGYIVIYPFAVIGMILSIILIEVFFKVKVDKEISLLESLEANNDAAKAPLPGAGEEKPHVMPLCVGIALGVILGSIPIPIPGCDVPAKLGLAGGPLLVSIFLSTRRIGSFHFQLPKPSNLMIRELGIALFLSCVGLGAGSGFLDAMTSGDGFKWILMGIFITLIPIWVVATVARAYFKVNFISLCGIISGSHTDPPALGFSFERYKSNGVLIGYATVYPMAMFLRIIGAQVLALIFLA